MTHEQIYEFEQHALQIRRSLDRATEHLSRCENALRVASAKLEVLTTSLEKRHHEQHPPSS